VKLTPQDVKNLSEAQDLIDKAYKHFVDYEMGRWTPTDGTVTVANGSYFERKFDIARLHIKVESSVFACPEQGFTNTQELLEWAKKTYRDEIVRIA
jgi:hypothetical protein